MNKLQETSATPVYHELTRAPTYLVRRVPSTPIDGTQLWDHAALQLAGPASVSHFHSASSEHRPVTEARILHDDHHIYVWFQVADRYVRCRHTQYQSLVSEDSCVEVFLQPPGLPYMNFEFNCGGAMLLYWIEDPTRSDGVRFRKYCEVPEDLGSLVRVQHTMPRVVDPEIEQPVSWRLTFTIPAVVLEKYFGRLFPLTRSKWRGNLFKCGDRTSHPHWASWSPIGKELRFHDPRYFGNLVFE